MHKNIPKSLELLSSFGLEPKKFKRNYGLVIRITLNKPKAPQMIFFVVRPSFSKIPPPIMLKTRYKFIIIINNNIILFLYSKKIQLNKSM